MNRVPMSMPTCHVGRGGWGHVFGYGCWLALSASWRRRVHQGWRCRSLCAVAASWCQGAPKA